MCNFDFGWGWVAVMEIQLDSSVVNLVALVEKDLSKAINEALNLWLKQKIIVCPITNKFCKFPNGTCNECPISQK
jgi:hypothetical protein